MARYCDSTVREELCCLKPMPSTTKGEDVAKVFMEHFNDRGIDISNIFAITTDGAPAMVGIRRGAVRLIEEKAGHPIMKLHCIIPQENLCAKRSNSDLNEVNGCFGEGDSLYSEAICTDAPTVLVPARGDRQRIQ